MSRGLLTELRTVKRDPYKRARWVTLEEAYLLHDIVDETGVEYVIEAGTANGYSAAWMACAGAKVITFDPYDRKKIWNEHKELGKGITYVQDSYISAIIRCSHLRSNTKLFFIDGEHDYESIQEDVAVVYELAQEGDIVIFHDLYEGHGEVKAAWSELMEPFGKEHTVYDTARGIGRMTWAMTEKLNDGFGGGALSRELYSFIRKVLPDGGTILELGSGRGTEKLAEHYNMISIEHDEEWVGKFNSTYIHAPLTPCLLKKFPKQKVWYDRDAIREGLKRAGKYDLILVDGPPGDKGRAGFWKYVQDLFDYNVPIVFDDLQRAAEDALIKKVAGKLERAYTTYVYPSGHFGIIHPKGEAPYELQ
jgi:predicted O-methyltransferase YrrM